MCTTGRSIAQRKPQSKRRTGRETGPGPWGILRSFPSRAGSCPLPERMDGRENGRMGGWKGGWVEERMGEGMEEWVGGEGARTFCPSSIHPSNPLARPLAATQEGNSGWAHLIGSSGSTVDPMRAVSEWRTSWEGEAPAEPPGSQQRLSRSFALPHPPQGAILKQPLGLVLPARGATSPRHRRRKQTQEAWLCFLVRPTRVSLGPTCAQDAPRTRTKTLSILSRRRHGRPAHQSEPPRAIGPLRS